MALRIDNTVATLEQAPMAVSSATSTCGRAFRWLSNLPEGRDLERDELKVLATAIAEDRRGWQQLVRHDAGRRHFVQLHRDPHVDVWLLCWANQQETGLHDHDLSSGAVHVCQGDLIEDRLEFRDELLSRVSIERREGSTFDFDSSHVHCIRHPDGAPPAVSIHVYSPALWRMGFYEIGDDGLLRRSSVSYAEEMAA
jgi:Cysteine dioxygenase type I